MIDEERCPICYVIKEDCEHTDEIERLRGELAAALKNEVHYAKRIEELESPYSVVLDRSVPPAPSLTIFGDAQRDTHIITREQINAAWERWEEEKWVSFGHGMKEALSILGIVRCEECDGSGESPQTPTNPPYIDKCPTCDGDGWVKK